MHNYHILEGSILFFGHCIIVSGTKTIKIQNINCISYFLDFVSCRQEIAELYNYIIHDGNDISIGESMSASYYRKYGMESDWITQCKGGII